MIWSNGKILPDDALSISINDRTFEHGLGLFETLRTWGGRPTLLDRHLARMLRSASELELPIDPSSLPDANAVRMLLDAEGIEGDRLLRITASGGSESSPSVVWMRTGTLPEPISERGARLLMNSWRVSPDDTLARHKTLNYWTRRRAHEEARRQGFDEGLSGSPTPGRCIYEGSRTNLFLVRNGGLKFGLLGNRRPILVTSDKSAPIVPGIMREIVIEIAGDLSLEVDESQSGIGVGWFSRASEVFLTNSVRGIIPVRQLYLSGGLMHSYPQNPGPWTRQLQEALARHLWPQM